MCRPCLAIACIGSSEADLYAFCQWKEGWLTGWMDGWLVHVVYGMHKHGFLQQLAVHVQVTV